MTLNTDTKYNTPVFKKNQPDDSYKIQPLPPASGAYPYRLSLSSVLPDLNDQKLVFHLVGDTGNLRDTEFLHAVASAMTAQCEGQLETHTPRFLYHLGDIVYNHGEAPQYHRQFFEPYEKYPVPILAIAGNHDSDVNPESAVPYHSLDAFTTVFCDTASQPVSFSKSGRKSIVQPNVYWTLNTPLATIIGLHTNVPKYGAVSAEQRAWFIEELKSANLERPGKALIVCLHHAPYSADVNHGASLPMIELLESAFNESGVRPDIVFSGHVHNYQRFIKRYNDGGLVPFIVAGAGGYDELHPIATVEDDRFDNKSPLLHDILLEKYCDNHHGFLKIILTKTLGGVNLTGEYYQVSNQQEDTRPAIVLTDSFTLQLG
ncbi:MAG: metallophosphoesterase family protein [Mucilaginibacter sp.]